MGSSGSDPRDDFIARVVQGKSFCDVGGLWGTVSEKVSVAHAAGARRLTMIDITPPDEELWQAFRARLDAMGIHDVECISADITASVPQRFDIVHCSGVIYHVPNPLGLLTALREMTSEHLILSSAIAPAKIRNASGAISFKPGQTVFVPYLDRATFAVLQRHFNDQSITTAVGISSPAETWRVDDYAPWWWLLTPSLIRQMLLVAQFEIVDEAAGWNGNAHVFLARCA